MQSICASMQANSKQLAVKRLFPVILHCDCQLSYALSPKAAAVLLVCSGAEHRLPIRKKKEIT